MKRVPWHSFTNQLDIGEELHFHSNGAVALARLATAARHVERKMACRVTSAFGVRRVGKNFANGIKRFQVRGGIGARRAPDSRLIDDHHFANLGVALHNSRKIPEARAVARREGLIQSTSWTVRSFGTAYASDDGKSPLAEASGPRPANYEDAHRKL